LLLTRLVAALEEVFNGLWSRFLNKDRPNMNNNKDVFKNVLISPYLSLNMNNNKEVFKSVQVGMKVSTGKG
jgi:hypothetical protein